MFPSPEAGRTISRCLLLAFLCSGHAALSVGAEPDGSGKALYDFYCYQCHGYTGDAGTLAAAYLEPKPKDFTRADPAELSRDRMLDALANGRPGTAMVSFASVIDAEGRERIVEFIRREIMQPAAPRRRYHTAANGWPEHERFTAAFPFAIGTIPLATAVEQLSANERRGRALYLSACVTCHDHGGNSEEPLIWDLKPLSFPRRHYSHRSGHLISSASPYAVHDRRPEHGILNPAQAEGQRLFEQNCAFCHGMDGTGRNWIGRFMEPHARDLTSVYVARMDRSELRRRIERGLPGSSMPGWSAILSSAEIEQVIAYLIHVLAHHAGQPTLPETASRPPKILSWQRRQP